MKQPELGWTTPVKVERVIDGDTIEVSVTKKFMVRLQDDDGYFDTPEIRKPASEEEIRLGKECSEYLEGLLFNTFDPGDGDILYRAKDGVVMHVDSDETGKISHSFNFTRVKGHLFVDGQDVTEKMNQFMKMQKGENE